jgi:hypothetical protein
VCTVFKLVSVGGRISGVQCVALFITVGLHFMATLYNDDLRPYFHKRHLWVYGISITGKTENLSLFTLYVQSNPVITTSVHATPLL